MRFLWPVIGLCLGGCLTTEEAEPLLSDEAEPAAGEQGVRPRDESPQARQQPGIAEATVAAQPTFIPPCNIGSYRYSTTCGIASTTTMRCPGGPLYEKSYYTLEYYTNGRKLRSTVHQTVYDCTPFTTDPFCSSICYQFPAPE